MTRLLTLFLRQLGTYASDGPSNGDKRLSQDAKAARKRVRKAMKVARQINRF